MGQSKTQLNKTPSFKKDVSLASCCTYGIGGPASFLTEIRSIDEMQNALQYCHSHQIRTLVIGKGSNCLFDDKGFKGAILINKIDFLETPEPGTFRVGAGYSFSLLGAQTARQSWAGLEFASGIPGSVGGAVFMNAGAGGGETAQHLHSVEFISSEGEKQVFTKEELSFSYRTSSFQKLPGAIVAATFVLTKDLEARPRQLAIISKRTASQPYSDKSAGCVFVNPAHGAAGALIDQCGLKGMSVGGAQVSTVHANFLINAGNATAHDMLALIERVKTHVKDSTGIELHPEIRLIPYE